MGYLDVYNMTQSATLAGRLTAAAAQEQAAGADIDPRDPSAWVGTFLWHLVSAPGWGDAWASAEASDPGGDHGANEGVVTDPQILSQVQAVIAAA